MAKVHETSHKDVILSSAGVTASLVLADPTIFLTGFSGQEQAERPPALVRGSLILRITKAAKIKAITLNFKGISRTDWPEGIPSDKSETHETKEVFAHEWRLFSAQFSNAEKSSGAHSIFALGLEQKALGADSEPLQPSTTSSTPHELVNQHEAVSKGYRVFNPAEYIYNFELMLPQRLPETLKCNFGSVRWGFTLTIERYGTFKPNLVASKEVTLLRSLGPSNLERSEPIVVSRDWEDLLHYEIIIAGKAFAIGQKFNVAFGLVPLAKVKCHRIRIYITEHTEYFCRNHRIHRVEPSHKFLLLEKKSPDGNRGDLLKTVGQGVTALTEFEFNVEIPETFPSRRDYLRPNANTEYIKVYHWIKAVMRLSRQDKLHNGEPKCYEVSIDSPITLVDPRTTFANELPDYKTAKNKNVIVDALKPYQEFIQKESSAAAVRNASEHNGPGVASSSRAIMFARQPSIAPPPFDADVQPPELLPPQYDLLSESVKTYERRYEEYLITTGRLPPSGSRLAAGGNQNLPDSASSGSNTSLLSQNSENGSGSTAITTSEEVPEEEARKPAPSSPHEGSTTPSQSREPTPNPQPSASTTQDSGSAKQPPAKGGAKKKPPHLADLGSKSPSSRSQHTPVFSEIIWTEDAEPVSGHDEMVDPRNEPVTSFAEVSSQNSTPSPASSLRLRHANSALASPSSIPPIPYVADNGSPTRPSTRTDDAPTSPLVPGAEASSSPASPGTDSSPAQSFYSAAQRIQSNDSGSTSYGSPPSVRSAGGQSTEVTSPRPVTKQVPRPFSPPLSHNMRMRNSFGEKAGSAMYAVPGNYAASGPNSSVAGRRQGPNGPRLSLKTPTPFSVSAGSPINSPWGAADSNAAQLFGDRWMDRRDSSGSFATSPRYFRQSSVVSMDVTRQAAGELPMHRDSLWNSRRPSRVGEVQEFSNWNSMTAARRDSAASVAVSIAEYQGLTSERQGANVPLLGDEESEMDLGLEWEHDFEDYELENDRRSVVSAFYTVLTP